MQTLIKQVKILDTKSSFHLKTVDVLIEKGRITQLLPKIVGDFEKVIEGKSLYLTQGWIDIFSDFSEPGFEYREDIASGAEAAQAGGFKQVFVLPNTLPTISSQSEVQLIKQKSQFLPVEIHPLGSISQSLKGIALAEMLEMRKAGAIAFTEGWNSLEDANLSLKALEYVKAFDGVLIYLPYLASLSDEGWMHEGQQSTLLGMAGIPTIAETVFIQREIALAGYAGSKIHFTGISSKESVKIIREAKKAGVRVTCSVTPYHLLWTDEELTTYNSFYKTMPPLRTAEDRAALRAGVLDGTIDLVTSHHRPASWDDKNKEFAYTGWGIAGIQMVLPLLLKAMPEIQPELLSDLLVYKAQEIFNTQEYPIEEQAEVVHLTLFDAAGEIHPESFKKSSKAFNQYELKESLKGQIIF